MPKKHFFGERADWQAFKKKFGVPDKICKFSLGAKIEEFNKLVDKDPDDYGKIAPVMEQMIDLFETYHDELAKAKVDKFKGKTAVEQTKNRKDAATEIKKKIPTFQGKLGHVKTFSEPMAHLLKHYGAVIAKFNSLDKPDTSKVHAFYGQEIRNTLGVSVHGALKLKLGAKVLMAMQEYEDCAEEADEYLQGTKKAKNLSSEEAACNEMKKGLKALEPYIK